MVKLRIGKMKSSEIAQWMGVNYNTYRNQKQKKLKQLERFCDFTPIYGGVIIKQIYDPIYKSNIPDDEKVFLNEVKESNEGLASVAGIVRKLQKNDQFYKALSERQVNRRMTKWNWSMFGKYNNGQKEAYGTHGSRKYVYAIKIDDYNNYRRVTEEEYDLFRHIVKSVCGKETDKIIESMLLDEAFKNSDMSKEEYLLRRERFDLDLFGQVYQQFKKETGLSLVRIQEYKLNGIMLKVV